MMMRLKEIVNALKPYPDLYHNLYFDVVERFVWFAGHVKCKIQLLQSLRAFGPPLTLPVYILDFLHNLLALNSCKLHSPCILVDSTRTPSGVLIVHGASSWTPGIVYI